MSSISCVTGDNEPRNLADLPRRPTPPATPPPIDRASEEAVVVLWPSLEGHCLK